MKNKIVVVLGIVIVGVMIFVIQGNRQKEDDGIILDLHYLNEVDIDSMVFRQRIDGQMVENTVTDEQEIAHMVTFLNNLRGTMIPDESENQWDLQLVFDDYDLRFNGRTVKINNNCYELKTEDVDAFTNLYHQFENVTT